MFVIPKDFARQIIEYHEDDGTTWLERLPEILAACERRWQLRLEAPFANLSFHYVASATRDDGAQVVVKVHAPTREFEQETLRWSGLRAPAGLRRERRGATAGAPAAGPLAQDAG